MNDGLPVGALELEADARFLWLRPFNMWHLQLHSASPFIQVPSEAFPADLSKGSLV